LTRARHRHEEKKVVPSVDGVTDDWGKTRPFWCLTCGRGYRSVERVLAHYSKAAHGNETMSTGSRGLTAKQQLEAFRLRNK
jgi:hypothetical protein